MTNTLKYGLAFLILSQSASAEILFPVTPRNQLDANVQASVTQDPSSHIYTYTYVITNSPSSAQNISTFAFDINENAKIFNETAPEGWSFGRYASGNLFSFASTEGITESHIHYFPNGAHEIRSPFDIHPSISKTFSFQTLSAPDNGLIYIQGYVPSPQSTDEGDFDGVEIPSQYIKDDSFQTATIVPIIDIYDGNRRPAVDGFAAFPNISSASGSVFTAPVKIFLDFAINGETVNEATFKAELNGVDITSLFVVDNNLYSDRVLELALGSGSPLQAGKNVLITSVEGIVPDTERFATDTDRITFTVEP